MGYSRLERLNKELERAISEEDYELALGSIQDMIEIEPKNPQLFNSLGVVLAKLKRYDEAIISFDTALKMDSSASKVWYSKGAVLMENGSLRQALACFYKSLDLDPAYEKAKERFNKCLDEMVLASQVENEPRLEGPYIEGPADKIERTIPPPGESGAEGPRIEAIEAKEQEERERARQMKEPRARKKRGSYLDDDMFGEREEGQEGEEDEDVESWSSPDENERETEGMGSDEQLASEGEEGAEEVWGNEEASEDWGDSSGPSYLKCRCGDEIRIDSKDRPYRFECGKCGRTGTLK